MVEKMKYINIMGPVHDMDRMVEIYLSKYNIQLEYTIKELATEKGLVPFSTPNPYTALLKKAVSLVELTELKPDSTYIGKEISRVEAVEIIEYATAHFDKLTEGVKTLKSKRDEINEAISIFSCYEKNDFQIEKLDVFKFISYRFGKMPISSYKQFETFLYKDAEILFMDSMRDNEYQWGAYFVSGNKKDKVDSMFSSLHFELINLPREAGGIKLKGTPAEIIEVLKKEIQSIDEIILEKEKSMMDEAHYSKEIKIDKLGILAAYHKLTMLDHSFGARKFAAKTTNDFYIFVGWMTGKEAEELEKELENDKDVVFIIEDNNKSILSKPPTKLKNPKIFKPFEFFIKMYGLPSYDEIDPTPFMALTYTLMFGIMFGDIGQGLVLSLLGLFLWEKKGIALGRIMTIIGASSTFFGLLFGSVFGYEFKAIWMHPAAQENMTNVLLYAIGMGIVVILSSMVFNLANAIRKKEIKKVLFDPNGVAGFVLYTALIVLILAVITGNTDYIGVIVGLFIIVPLICMALRIPIINILNGKKKIIHGGVPLFLFETVIELFEVLLGYFSNTVSFVRVGAFALSHACMMSIVFSFAEGADGSYNIAIIIIGNLFVMLMEGLIVGIQALRLQFYEMFSRFYKGTGRVFEPYTKKK